MGKEPAQGIGIEGAIVQDIFGRTVNRKGIVLVDWEGQITNPAMTYYVGPPEGSQYPVKVELSSTEPRIYFDLPSETGPNGSRKSMTIQGASSDEAFYVSIFPDRDDAWEKHELTVKHTDANGVTGTEMIDVYVIDQDLDRPAVFQVHLDFSHDQTGLFDDPAVRETTRQAAEDWVYFFDDMKLDEVPAGEETTWIWSPQGYSTGEVVTNRESYTGFLLYVYGIQHADLRAGGEGSYYGGYQSSGGKHLPIKRSGGVSLEKRGNYNTLRWMVTATARDWWRATNLRDTANDVYSIARHEMGHSLAFNLAHDGFAELKLLGHVEDAAVAEYHGYHPPIDSAEHLPASIDRASRRGAFGNEFHGDMSQGRWLVTKLDLLVAQAVGYKLRRTSPFEPLSIVDEELHPGQLMETYSGTLTVIGGTPTYHWTLERGALPNGLVLDPFTGSISGIPTDSGDFEFVVRVRDYREWDNGITHSVSLSIAE